MKNKKLKKYIQKQIQKQVSADFAGFDNRVYECEKTLGLTENSPNKEIFKYMMAEFNQRPFSWVKVAESEKEILLFEPALETTGSEAELTELPDKWCVEVTDENNMILTDWKIKISDGEFNSTAKGYKFIRNNGEGFTEEESDYSIISFSDFERLVLNKPKELEVGKWYRVVSGFHNYLLLFSGKDESLGFFNENWDRWSFTDNKQYAVEASKEEVESALISEAERRGFKDGVKYISASTDSEFVASNNFRFGCNEIETRLLSGQGCIFYNGKWAEIIQEKEIDWSVPQLVKRIKDNLIVQTTGVKGGNIFEGMVVAEVGKFKKGNLRPFNKSGWKKFNGSICLKND